MPSMDSAYRQLREDFLQFHQNDNNIILHLFTTGLGIIGGCSLVYRCSNRSLGTLALLLAIYMTSLVGEIPLELVVIVFAFLAGLVIPVVKAIELGVVGSLVVIAVGYFGQDAAHFFTNELTFQSSYSGPEAFSSVANATSWISTFSEHTFFLLPLTVDAALPLLPAPLDSLTKDGLATPEWMFSIKEHIWILAALAVWVCGCFALDSDSGPFPFMFVKRRMLKCNLGSESLRKDLAAIRKWATDHKPSRETTTHWWFSDLKEEEGKAFDRIANSKEVDDMFRQKFAKDKYAVDVIAGMNEVYVSGPAKVGSSDTVFTTSHTDGPWALVPFCCTYRCILGLDSSGVYTTVFPSVPLEITCRTGDLAAFDYNREVHLIIENPKCKEEQAQLPPELGGDAYRIVLKLHYCTYPRILWPLGKLAAVLSLGYNILFRKIFLFSIAPSDLASRIMAFLVVNVTILYRMAIDIGFQNMLYVAVLFAMGKLVHPVMFLVGTSFVHYPRYLVTYFRRRDVNFGTFKSDVLFFKVIAVTHIAVRYLFVLAAGTSASAGLLTASLLMIVFGATVSSLATRALGMDGTYFGKELGVIEGPWVTTFPYDVIPHPMILGQLVAFAGVHMLPEFRASWPLLMPTHCAFYMMVMIMEHFDIHGGKFRRFASEAKVKTA